ncbi:hypothetical protein LMH66_03985 [Shewanella sp. 10N.7]|uniref:hypothetical protein n=1 Tax=Shewanella sp. 10N.7 TaxID=2885093 RepID=UPI001E5E1BA5|nr:hypothetical protein [Shewanella sp. 10N.7]MCC4831787.1 hypothetical protein [Shewanella sp. 10N.7]
MPQIGKDEVSEDLEEFVERIFAPESLGGLKQIFQMIVRIRNISFHSAQSIMKDLHLPTYIFDALHNYSFHVDDRFISNEYHRTKYQKGWCSEYPFYVVLLKSYEYNLTIKSCELFAAFINHYFLVLDTLRDKDLARESSTREEDACSNFRLFMRTNVAELNFVRETIPNSTGDPPTAIARQLDQYLDSKETWTYQPNKNYLRTLCHFFTNDWKPAKHKCRKRSPLDRVPKRYADPTAIPIVGAYDDIFALIPDEPLIPSSEGLNEDDHFPAQIFVINNRDVDSKRDKTELLDTVIPFNRHVQNRKAIDVTASVRRSHNMGIQNTQLLMPEELNFLIGKLIELGNQPANREMTIVIWLMLLLSKSVKEIQSLVVFTDLSSKQQGLYVDELGQGWWFFYVSHSAKAKLNNEGLREIKEEVFTPCPVFLHKLIVANRGAKLTGPIIKEKDSKVIYRLVVRKLKKLSDRHASGRVSVRRLVNFISYYLNSTDVIDSIFIDYSYAVNMYTTRVARSYANVSDHFRSEQLDKLWQNVEQDIAKYTGKPLPISLFELRHFDQANSFIGSSFTPTNDAISTLINALTAKVSASIPSYQHHINDIVDYHNAFTAYTAWMLLFGTGYRAAWNPLPTFALFLPSLNLMGISDKDDSDFSHSRIVAVPNILASQLKEYKRHLGCLRSILRVLMPKLSRTIDNIVDVDQSVLSFNHSQASQWYRIIRNSRKEQGPFFFLYRQGNSVVAKNLSPSELVNYCKNEIQLPANAGRHWLKSHLLEKNICPELINFQMGHWQAGEVPLGHYSALSHIEAINELVPVLDELFAEVGWKVLKSVIS